MTTFGKRFRELRTGLKLTQDQFAEKFFLNKSNISRYEQDKQMPEVELLKKIADFFDVDVDYLLGTSDIKRKEITETTEDLLKKVINEILASHEIDKDTGKDIVLGKFVRKLISKKLLGTDEKIDKKALELLETIADEENKE